MERVRSGLETLVARLWRIDRPLTATGLLMVAALAASGIGLWLDPRTITGAPAWLKPAKFAASIGVYTLTLAWVFSYLPGWPKMRRIVGWTTASVLVIEVAIIDLQVWRGTTSHFNVSTPLDGALFSIMGTGILLQTLASIAVAVALWRQPFADRAMGWVLRFGMSITIIGGLTGGLMVQPTAAQVAEARVTHRMTVSGGHTVGAPDGEPGMPGTHWSTEHGDLRVSHFVGLHALQALPLALFVFRRRKMPETGLVRVAVIGAASYTLLFAILLWQALRGQALVRPDAATIAAFAGWAMFTAAAAVWIAAARRDTATLANFTGTMPGGRR